MQPKKIYLICTGLGTVNRGFESYISELAERLSDSPIIKFSLRVLSGGFFKTTKFNITKLPCIKRNNRWLGFFVKDIHQLFLIEQVSYFFFLLPYLILKPPAAIYLGEYRLYCYLFKIRKWFKLDYRLILYTGGQAIPGLFDPGRDYVHHITDVYIEELTRMGYPAARQFLLPHFIKTDVKINDALYNKLLSKTAGKKVLLTVGSLDNKVKRMTLLAQSISFDIQNIFPIFLGNETNETPDIIAVLQKHFGAGNYIVANVGREELNTFYGIADLFVLASVNESFGLVLLEAMLLGKPVMCQPYAASAYVTRGKVAYLNKEDIVTWNFQIRNALSEIPFPICDTQLRNFVLEHYSWNVLGEKYCQMFEAFAEN